MASRGVAERRPAIADRGQIDVACLVEADQVLEVHAAHTANAEDADTTWCRHRKSGESVSQRDSASDYNGATLGLFFAIAFAITWTLFITVATRVPAGTVVGQLLILGGAASPAIAAMLLTWWKGGAHAVHAL